ncbi:MAG: hypothetical protein HDS79_08100 [Bacteroidales bacterium]|nr:hypothetical protein [Bacteroidales bacterium]
MIHILFWNPDISSMTRDRMTDEMTEILNDGGCFNWSFWEHENVREGDVCYLVRCSDESGPHGVVLRGKIISTPYQDQDWAGKGRKVFYADWYPQEFIDSEYATPLSPERLEKAMPDFNWRGGHSGRELSVTYGEILEKLWYDYLKELLPELGNGLMVNPRADELTPQTLDFWKVINSNKED